MCNLSDPLFWVCIFVYVCKISGEELNCQYPFECENEQIVNNDNVFGNGYKSILGPLSSIDVTSNSKAQVYLSGGFSGYDIDFVLSLGSVFATGESSAISRNELVVSYPGGFGSSSFSGCNILSLSAQMYGGMSGYDTRISLTGPILDSFGALSNANSEINVNNDGFSAHFTGYLSGYNSVINCIIDSKCSIFCHGNSCFGLSLNCPVGSTCNVYGCDNSNGNSCPITYGEALPQLPSDEKNFNFIINMTMQSMINVENCEAAEAVLYGDGFDDGEFELGLSIGSTTGNICCMGKNSCNSFSNIIIENGYDIICSSGKGCQYVSNINTQNSPNSGVYCNGYNSCFGSSINGEISSGNIVCGGYQACKDGKINSGSNLYCMGKDSCFNTQINSILKIYATGESSLEYSVINTNGQDINVYLAAWKSGYKTIINCQNGDFCNIYCKSKEACTDTTINSFCSNHYVECDDSNGFDCPNINIISSTCSPTPSPTPHPTSPPTREPTSKPTGEPTECVSTQPSCIIPCRSYPCECWNAGECNLNKCDKKGCHECKNGYWKQDYNYRCISCFDKFGSDCISCQDFIGCTQCKQGSTLTESPCGFFYCKKNC